MTNKAIYDNLKRLLIFIDVYKEEKIIKFNNYDIIKPIDLIHEYSRHLDIHGCPKEGLSYLIVNDSDFNEFKNCNFKTYPSNKEMEVSPYNNKIKIFDLDGYDWIINNKDCKAVMLSIITVRHSEINEGQTIIYFSEQDHFNKGAESPVKEIKKITIASTGENFEVSDFNSDEANKHNILINKEINIKKGETLIINNI